MYRLNAPDIETNTPLIARLRCWRSPHLLHDLWFGSHIANSTAVRTLPRYCIFLKPLDCRFDLRTQIGAVEAGFMYFATTILAVPSQPVDAALRSGHLQYHSNSVLEAYGVVWGVWWEKKHLAFSDVYVSKVASCRLDRLEQHATFVLVEKLGCLIDVVVCSRVWSANHHHCQRVIIDAIVVDGWL